MFVCTSVTATSSVVFLVLICTLKKSFIHDVNILYKVIVYIFILPCGIWQKMHSCVRRLQEPQIIQYFYICIFAAFICSVCCILCHLKPVT